MSKKSIRRLVSAAAGTAVLLSGACGTPNPEKSKSEKVINIPIDSHNITSSSTVPTTEAVDPVVSQRLDVERKQVSSFLTNVVLPHLNAEFDHLAHGPLATTNFDRSETNINGSGFGKLWFATSDGFGMSVDYTQYHGSINDFDVQWFKKVVGGTGKVMLGRASIYDGVNASYFDNEVSDDAQVGSVCYDFDGYQDRMLSTGKGADCSRYISSPLEALKGTLSMLERLEDETGINK